MALAILPFLLVYDTLAFMSTRPPFPTRAPFQSEPTTVAFSSVSDKVSAPAVPPGSREELESLYNTQITRELAASQLYLSASIWCDQRELIGMSSFMLEESSEERSHALSFVDFAMKRDIPINLQEVPAPKSGWNGPEELWADLLEAERENTQAIQNLADAAQACHDWTVMTFLQPFIMEQVNSEDSLGTIVAKVTDENKTPGLLRQLDYELASKVKKGG